MKLDDKHSTMTSFRIAVLGDTQVGKSALTVRYLTRRFIGEYRSKTDLLYTKTVTTDAGAIDVEIVDVSIDSGAEFPSEQIQWADACVIVYSITDRESFRYAENALSRIGRLKPAGVVTFLVANKNDLDHLRQVTKEEGMSLGSAHNIGFCEVSVAENSSSLYTTFERIIVQSKERKESVTTVKPRKFSVSKMIGTLIGNNSDNMARKMSFTTSSSTSSAAAAAAGSAPPKQKLTMVEFGRSELLQTRDIRRQGGFAIAVSI